MGIPPRFYRYQDLSPAALNVEYQVHTTQTDGEATIQQILAVAMQQELGAIAFTEHVRRDTVWFPRFAQEVRATAGDFAGLQVFVGCESKVTDLRGRLDVSDETLSLSDLVLGSVHRFPDKLGGYYDLSTFSADDMAELEFRLSIGMIMHAPIHVLAHPGGMYQRRHGIFPEPFFREMMLTALDRGVAIEINSSYLQDFEGFLRLCHEVNPFVSIGSDAHKLEDVGRCRDLIRLSKAVGC